MSLAESRPKAADDPIPPWPVLCCPGCLAPLLVKEDERRCGVCGQAWPAADGVVYFSGCDPRVHQLDPAQWASLARGAAALGWQHALHDELRLLNPAAYRHAIGQYRVHWRFLLPMGALVRVLDLNCGLGATSFGLANSCGTIVAADASANQAWFVASRARQSNVSNIQAIQLGVEQPLPFQTGSFDSVVFADGLGSDGNQAIEQRRLNNAHRVLRARGTLLFAEANRLTPVGGSTQRRTGLQSTAGYVRQIRQAGFHQLRKYALLPSHREPYFVIPLDEPAYLGFFLRTMLRDGEFERQLQRRNLGSLYRLLKAGAATFPSGVLARLVTPLVPGVAIVASR
jgi:SAM-dependent methyltransferase